MMMLTPAPLLSLGGGFDHVLGSIGPWWSTSPQVCPCRAPIGGTFVHHLLSRLARRLSDAGPNFDADGQTPCDCETTWERT